MVIRTLGELRSLPNGVLAYKNKEKSLVRFYFNKNYPQDVHYQYESDGRETQFASNRQSDDHNIEQWEITLANQIYEIW